ncbi:uncharacterized protein LOC112084359 [Eutrema salsugineum]|uniref:uncharacterized protein LOC112084359 n=1 Tax=Eutrema salsugineum TaxID=72664 RepID=UPI000CED69CD|nr:uncharacterized protein LOC112084359 [Eutrema salsugineum]
MDDGKDAPSVDVCGDDDVSLFVQMRYEIEQLNLCFTVHKEDTHFVPQTALVEFVNTGKDDSENMEDDGSEKMDELAAICLACEEVDLDGGSDEEFLAGNGKKMLNFSVDDSAEANSAVVRKKRHGKAWARWKLPNHPNRLCRRGQREGCILQMVLQVSQTIIRDEKGVMFISVRHSSIYSGLKKVYPSVGHGACLVHLARNVTTKFKESCLPSLMVRAAKAYMVYEFNQLFAELRRVSSACAEYLTNIRLPHWTRAYCVGQCYNVMTTNFSESLNKVLKECTEFPLISILEAIRMSLMGWFVRRRSSYASEIHLLTSKVRDIMDDIFYEGTKLKTRINNRLPQIVGDRRKPE